VKNRLADPSEIFALDFARELPRFEKSLVSATIGINWSICGDLRQNPRHRLHRKKTVIPGGNDQLDEIPPRPSRMRSLGPRFWPQGTFATTEVQHGDGVSRMAASHLGLIASNEPTKPDPNDPALTARGKVVSAGRTGVCYFGRRSHGRW
jgi:hypothetical protein